MGGTVTTEDNYRHALLVAGSRADEPDGFFCFYELIHGHTPPRHIQTMVREIYKGKAVDKGALIFSFRGSWKTTSLSVTFTAWRMGLEPQRANLIVGVNDDAAGKIAKQIADIIGNNPHWKDVFPHVIPDKERGWAGGGYELKVTHYYVEVDDAAEFRPVSYEQWRADNVARKDPSLLALGYTSGSLIGKHPDGVLVVDDIHNEENTDSDRERQRVLTIVQDTLFPTIVENPTLPVGQQMVTWNIWVGTPWREDDAYHFVRDTQEFYFVNVPAMYPVLGDTVVPPDATIQHFDHDDLQGAWVLNWPERFDARTAIRWYKKVGKRGFWRMFLLNLTGASEFGVRYYEYNHEDIDVRWPIVGGVDYASIVSEDQRNDRNRSFFAMFYGAKLPNGGIVIIDGVVQRVLQTEAERLMMAAQNLYPGYQYTTFEADGKGEEALVVFRRNPGLKIYPLKTQGQGKKQRLGRELVPWIENGSIRISNENTPALNMLRKSLQDFPNGLTDTLDAVYWVARGAPDALRITDLHKPLGYPGDPRRKRNDEPTNPYVALGRS